MDAARRLERGCACSDGPGAGFLRPRGDEGNQPEQPVARPDDPVEARLLQTQRLQKLRALPGVCKHGDLRLDGSGHGDAFGALAGRARRRQPRPFIARGRVSLADIAHIKHRLCGEQLQAPEDRPVVRAVKGDAARRAARLQRFEHGCHRAGQDLLLPVAGRRALLRLVETPLQAFEVRQHELGLDRLGVAPRVDSAFHMRHAAVLEAAQHMGDGVHFADIGEETVAQPLAARGAAHQPGDIDELQEGRLHAWRPREAGDFFQARVRNCDAPDIRLDRAERIVLRLGLRGRRQRVEERGLADIRQPYNAAFEAHAPVRPPAPARREAADGSGSPPGS